MSKKGWNSKMDLGFPLPEDHLPTGRVCVTFEIPDDRVYAQDVIGHIWQLGKWWNWEKAGGADRRATEAAQLFRTAIHETLCVEKYREMGCKCEDKATYLHRVTADGDLEISTDGGVTWIPDPSDPRIVAPQFPPLPGSPGLDKKCQAAANVRYQFEVKADQLAADAGQWAGLTAMLGALIGLLIFLSIIGTGGALTPVVMALGAALIAFGRDAFIAAMTEDVYEKFQCAIFCNMDDNGVLIPGSLDAIMAEVVEELGAEAINVSSTYINGTIRTLGEIGINNMAATATTVEADCSSCEECLPEPTVWFVNANGEANGIYENEDGWYYVDSGSATLYPGTYYGTIWFTNPDAPVYNSTCNRMNDEQILSGTPTIENFVNCDGGSGVQFCNNAYQFVDNMQWTMRFHVPPECP